MTRTPTPSRPTSRGASLSSLALALLWACGTMAPPLLAASPQTRAGREGAGEARRVLQAADAFFAAVRTGNADLAASLLSPDGGMLFFERRNDDGSYSLHHKSNSRWLEEFRAFTGHMEDIPSRSRVQVWGPVATISQSFVFRINGRLSHCGVNLFQLVRVDRDWRIANIVWTEERQGCSPRNSAGG